MKRIMSLLCVGMFLIGGANLAYADGIDVKLKGLWDYTFGPVYGNKFAKSVHDAATKQDDPFHARHRVRTQINFIASENLQGVLMFEIGDLHWGRTTANGAGRSSGGSLDTDGVNVETKHAFLDWTIPGTDVSVRMGLQRIKLPTTPIETPLLNADVAGIVVNTPVNDALSVTGFWLRPFDQTNNDGSYSNGVIRHLDDETDIFGLVLPLRSGGWKVTPWGMLGFVGANSGYYGYMFGDQNMGALNDGNGVNSRNDGRSIAWWAGLHFELSALDPLVFNFEGMYGDLHKNSLNLPTAGLNHYSSITKNGHYYGNLDNLTADAYGTRGWFMSATLDYKLDWATPGIFGWYASGDSADSDGTGQLGRMPIVGNDGTSFSPTTFGTAGGYNISTDGIIMCTGVGTWGLGIQLAQISFIPDLSSTVRVAYYRGTNDSELISKNGAYLPFYGAGDKIYLTDKDSVFEVNFDHKYNIYENLSAWLELGYLRLNADKDVWHNKNRAGIANANSDGASDAWKAQLLLQYSF